MTVPLSPWKTSRRGLLLKASALGVTSLLRTPAQAGGADESS